VHRFGQQGAVLRSSIRPSACARFSTVSRTCLLLARGQLHQALGRYIAGNVADVLGRIPAQIAGSGKKISVSKEASPELLICAKAASSCSARRGKQARGRYCITTSALVSIGQPPAANHPAVMVQAKEKRRDIESRRFCRQTVPTAAWPNRSGPEGDSARWRRDAAWTYWIC